MKYKRCSQSTVIQSMRIGNVIGGMAIGHAVIRDAQAFMQISGGEFAASYEGSDYSPIVADLIGAGERSILRGQA